MNMPGPGDPETWPPYTGQANDPRAPLDPLEDYAEVDPTDTICPICCGLGAVGPGRPSAGKTYTPSPLESRGNLVMLRKVTDPQDSFTITYDGWKQLVEEYPECVCTAIGGEHPDARCHCGNPALRDPDGEYTKKCPEHLRDYEDFL